MIAIVPAKGTSTRVAQKNMQLVNGIPLFWYSVLYARANGIFVVCSTDSPYIKDYCMRRNCCVVDECVDDSTMVNCVRNVLRKVPATRYALLQPTSPIRPPGLLRRILHMDAPCVYTAQRIKMVGHLIAGGGGGGSR